MIGLITVVGGNLQNVRNMLSRLELDYVEIVNGIIPPSVSKVILPGVGSFPVVMAQLAEAGLLDIIRERAGRDFSFIGICSGMQVLADFGLEGGQETRGLGLIPGHVARLEPLAKSSEARIPHVSWSKVQPTQPLPGGSDYFYFTHSYRFHVEDALDVAAFCETEHFPPFPAIVRHGDVTGIQFHPEVSGKAGLNIMRNLLIDGGQT